MVSFSHGSTAMPNADQVCFLHASESMYRACIEPGKPKEWMQEEAQERVDYLSASEYD